MNELILKFHLLDRFSQKKVLELLNKLLQSKNLKNKKNKNSWPEQLMKVSVWKSNDIDQMEKRSKKFSDSWNAIQW
jgi:hypothetical protein